MTTADYLIIFSKILGALALLIYGMKVMSEALQKMAGSQLRHILGAMTTNRLTGMLTGTFITCAVQSSSATTVMTVSFVNAGLLTLAQAISVIMGANIGTTLTAWIMSLGYNVDLTMAVFPAFFVGIILIYSKRFRYIGDFLFGIAFLFFALVLLSAAGNDLDLQHNPDAINFFSSFDTNSRWTIILFLFIGTLITCLVQSSAAVMAITILLCSTGVLPIYLGIALVMGENIGTTATANLAALGANTQARRAALAHLFFNVIGVTWVMCLFYPFVDMVCSVVGYNPADTTISVAQRAAILPIVLAAFHTAFNVTNTALLIGFIPQLERLVCFVLPTKEDSDEEDFRLRFIQAGIMKTPELSVFEAQKEISSFGERIQRMFGMVQDLLHEQNPEKSAKLVERIKKYEVISDSMEIEIAKYLDHVGNAHLSDDTKMKIRNMLREISEIESIGDSCYNLARTISHGRENNERLTPELRQNVEQMFKLTDAALTQMNYTFQHNREKVDVNKSFEIENNINDLRERLRDQNIDDVNDHKYSYDLGTAYLDIIQECEKLGDYVINVVQARMNLRR
ncbi:Na/Pi cotransporter family protein [uncultured Alloprevotella sp.]|uniref:Na/Pi cotransporter family protein n=1 Tax=uncultured Alloprevotella sp. TaxID=1283315 RepID=UPI00325FBBD9